jgi:AmmeMemoRadiSam system protein A
LSRRKTLKMCPLRNDEKVLLLQIARGAIESALTHRSAPQTPSPSGSLAGHCGAFVTLHCRGRLRGCIGRVIPLEPLVTVVAECAVAAATEDPRFRSLQPADLPGLQIELSVLSCPQRAAPEEVQPGTHGLIVSQSGRRGVLLPQVATEHSWSRERFLEETCQKAGLAPDAWRSPDTSIEIFTAEIFSEASSQALSRDNDSAARAGPYSTSQKSPS